MEKKLEIILNNKLQQEKNYINERINGIFIFGLICGVILSYSSFIGYIFGAGTGILLAKHYDRYVTLFSTKIITAFNTSVNIRKNKLS